jgi:hypothetical protein
MSNLTIVGIGLSIYFVVKVISIIKEAIENKKCSKYTYPSNTSSYSIRYDKGHAYQVNSDGSIEDFYYDDEYGYGRNAESYKER